MRKKWMDAFYLASQSRETGKWWLSHVPCFTQQYVVQRMEPVTYVLGLARMSLFFTSMKRMFLHINKDLRKYIATSSKPNKRKPVKNMQPSEAKLCLRQTSRNWKWKAPPINFSLVSPLPWQCSEKHPYCWGKTLAYICPGK